MRDYKLVVLGAGGVGKSCLTVQFVQGVYIDTYDPTIEDSYRKTIEIDSKVFDLEILDTAGIAQFTAMRELYIKSGMGFLLVYSVTDRQSLEELIDLREQVLRIKDSERVPMVLVGNKADLKNERVVSVEEGIEVSSKWGKVPFYETSALLRSNVDEVFVDLVRQIIRDELENVGNTDNNDNTNSNNGNKRKPSVQQLRLVSTSKSAANAQTLSNNNRASSSNTLKNNRSGAISNSTKDKKKNNPSSAANTPAAERHTFQAKQQPNNSTGASKKKKKKGKRSLCVIL